MVTSAFRVTNQRRWLVGSFAVHVGGTLLFSILAQAFLSEPPPMQLLQISLQSMELPKERPAPEPLAVEPEIQPEPNPEPEIVEPPEPEPTLPEEVVAKPPEPVPDPVPGEEEALAPEPVEPELEVPVEPDETPVTTEDDVDFLDPSDSPSDTPAEPPAEEAVDEAVSAPEPQQVAAGATVQASASEGVDDTYLRLVQQKIGRRWNPTDAATRGLRQVSCVVSFRIGARGAVIAPTVTASSGLSVFDRRALASVERSAPLPPPPSRFGQSGLEIDFRFDYSR